jgi:hypothetical protein
MTERIFSPPPNFFPSCLSQIRKLITSAVANAGTQAELEAADLLVDRAVVGRGVVLKRIMPHGRNRHGTIRSPYSNCRITLRELSPEEREALAEKDRRRERRKSRLSASK